MSLTQSDLAATCARQSFEIDKIKAINAELVEVLSLYGISYSDADLSILAESTSGMGEINPTTAKREIVRRHVISKAKEAK